MRKYLSAFVLAGAIALASPATGHATVVGSAPAVVVGNSVHVQVVITESRGDVACGVIVQTTTQPPVAVASAVIPLIPAGPNGAMIGSWTSAPLPAGRDQVAVTCADADGPAGIGQTIVTIPEQALPPSGSAGSS
ncbi:MAG TPA: hypothetical protein VIW24_13240 [Aldersonia sp.]